MSALAFDRMRRYAIFTEANDGSMLSVNKFQWKSGTNTVVHTNSQQACDKKISHVTTFSVHFDNGGKSYLTGLSLEVTSILTGIKHCLKVPLVRVPIPGMIRVKSRNVHERRACLSFFLSISFWNSEIRNRVQRTRCSDCMWTRFVFRLHLHMDTKWACFSDCICTWILSRLVLPIAFAHGH